MAQEYGPSSSLLAWCGTPTCYLTQDQIGSTRLVTDANGLVGWRFDYLPFGEELLVGTGGRTAAMGYDYLENSFNPWDDEAGLSLVLGRGIRFGDEGPRLQFYGSDEILSSAAISDASELVNPSIERSNFSRCQRGQRR